MLTRFRRISFFMAYTVATIPLWHYIYDAKILLLMLVVILFAYLNIILSSVEVAQIILSSEKPKTPLPRWLPKNTKYEKWWFIVRQTLQWHLLLVPAKMGLALGFTQWLFTRPVILIGDFELFTHLYSYISYNRFSYDTLIPSLYLTYPQWQTLFIAVFTISIFALLETFMLAALIMATRRQKMLYIKLIGLRSFITLAILGATILIYSLANSLYSGERFHPSPCSWNYDIPNQDYTNQENLDFRNNARYDCIKKRVTETILISFITSIDQSILLSANIMRPTINFGIEDFSFETSHSWDNRLFVLRQCLAGILGIFLYLGTTWAILWFVVDEPEPRPIAS